MTAKDDRLFLNAVLWIAKTGALWRDLPERFGPWGSVWKRFDRWAKKTRNRGRDSIRPPATSRPETRKRDSEMKMVVSGGPVRAVAFPQADAGLPDTTIFISAIIRHRWAAWASAY